MPINLGQITFGIGADTTTLRSSINDITNFGAAVTAAATNANTAGTAIESAFRRQEAAVISALQKVQRFQDTVRNLQAPPAISAGLTQLSTRALDQMVQRMTSGRLSAIQTQREMERFNVTMGNASRIMNNYSAAMKQAEASSFSASLQKLSGAAILVAGPLSGIATRISVIANLADHFSLAWAGMIAGVAAGAFVFYKFATASIEVAKSLQNIQQTMAAVTGSGVVANLQMKYLADLSYRTGIGFNELAKQYSQVQAAAKGTNLEGERTNKIFETIAYAGAKLGLSTEEIGGSFKAIQQMMSKGVVSAEELKGQLGDRLPGAIQAFAAGMGVTTLKLASMMKQGEVSTSQLVKFADELKKRYNIDTSARVDTIAAAEGRLNTARTMAIDSLDKIVGISDAYKNILNKLADGLTGASSKSRDFITVLLQVGAAFAAAFAVPMISAGIGAIVAGITRLTSVIWGLNAATAAGAFTSFVKLLATASIAIAAYYGSEKLIQDMLGKTKDSYLKTTPAVEDYIEAQKKLVTSVRGPTNDYIRQQEDLLKEAEKQKGGIKSQAEAMQSWAKTLEDTGMSAEQVESQLKSMFPGDLGSKFAASDAAVNKYKKNLIELRDILKRQTDEENKARKDPEKEITTRQQSAMDKARETIKDTKAQYDRLYLSPAAKAYAETQDEINHKIETFKENLERAEIPADKLKKLVADYGTELRKLKEGELILKSQTSAFTALSDVFGRGMNTGLTNFVDVLVDGKDKMLALSDTAKAVAKDILQTFLKLAMLNPLKNFLFGTNESVMGGSSGMGGFFGSLFGGGSGSAPTMSGTSLASGTGGLSFPMFKNGGIMGPNGPVPLRKYAGGGIARTAQMAMFGEGSTPEAYVPLPDGHRIPVAMQGGGGSGMEVHIHAPVGHQSEQTKSTGSSGQPRLDVMFKRMFNEAAMGDIAQGGPMSKVMERQFGLNRARGLSS